MAEGGEAAQPLADKPGQWPVLALGEADWPEVRALFALVFGATLSPAMQAWKYADGRGASMGVRDGEGALVAHYGGGFRPMAAAEQRCTAVQMQDVMVAPVARDVLARFGPFGRMSRAFIARHMGPHMAAQFGFGFPSGRHMRLGQHLRLYWPLDSVWQWHWAASLDLAGAAAGEAWQVQPLDWGSQADGLALDAMAAQVRLAMPDVLMPVRDAAWWRHRFANHPEHRYATVWLSRPGHGRAAVAVLRRGSLGAAAPEVTLAVPVGGAWELMDWLALPEAEAHLLPALHGWAVAHGADAVQLWASARAVQAWPGAVLEAGAQELACTMAVTHAHVLGHPVDHWRGRVWVTGGDTDFR